MYKKNGHICVSTFVTYPKVSTTIMWNMMSNMCMCLHCFLELLIDTCKMYAYCLRVYHIIPTHATPIFRHWTWIQFNAYFSQISILSHINLQHYFIFLLSCYFFPEFPCQASSSLPDVPLPTSHLPHPNPPTQQPERSFEKEEVEEESGWRLSTMQLRDLGTS